MTQVTGSGPRSYIDMTPGPMPSENAPPTLVRRLTALWEAASTQRRLLLGIPLSIAVLAAVIVLLLPRLYRSEGSFLVEETSGAALPSAVMGLIGRLNGGSLSPGESPDFYVQLLTSRPILDSLLHTRPQAACGESGHPTVLERLSAGGSTPAESLFYGRQVLSKRVNASSDLRTGIVSVTVEAECPALARELLGDLLAGVNHFDVSERQSRGKLRREFAQARLSDAEAELRSAEDALQGFMLRNRQWDAPQLRFEYDRLQRQVAISDDLMRTLRREYETARLDEINSSPAITVVAPPSMPVEPSRPKRRLIVMVMAVLGVILGFTTAILRTLTAPLPEMASPELQRLHARFAWLRLRRLPRAG